MSDRFNDYAADAAAEIQHRDGLTIPPTIHRDITLAMDRGYDAFWGVVSTAMQTHGISGDDLGWDDSDARNALAHAVISLIAPNLPQSPRELRLAAIRDAATVDDATDALRVAAVAADETADGEAVDAYGDLREALGVYFDRVS